MEVVTDDLAGVRVGDQAQVDSALPGWQIGNVCDPDLLAGFGMNLLQPRFEQIRVAPETMVTARRLVICPLGHN